MTRLTAAVWQPLVYDAPPLPPVLTAEGQVQAFIASLRSRADAFIACMHAATDARLARAAAS